MAMYSLTTAMFFWGRFSIMWIKEEERGGSEEPLLGRSGGLIV